MRKRTKNPPYLFVRSISLKGDKIALEGEVDAEGNPTSYIDLPKTTKIYIDGDLVYVHRANIDIMSADLFK